MAFYYLIVFMASGALYTLNIFNICNDRTGAANRLGASIKRHLREKDKQNTLVITVLCSIWGAIVGFFIIFVCVGAIKAYRHPERDGPRDGSEGQTAQTRMHRITRAMLDTIPVIRLGAAEHSTSDIELQKAASKTPTRTDGETKSCSICTEDFSAHDNVRILPCGHEFHPACVDPWLITKSSTCPLW